MSATTTVAPTLTLSSGPGQRMKLDGQPANYGDFRDELNRNGYVVVKGTIPRDRADAYSDKFYSYLESL